MPKINPMTDEDFDRKGGSYFDPGVYEVVVASVKREDPEGKSPFAQFEVEGHNGEQASARLYLSTAAAPYTLQKLATIAVHNKTTDADKDAVRKAFKTIDDTDLIDQKWLQKFVDMQAWLRVEEDQNAPNPNGGYYKRFELFGYEPKPRTGVNEVQQMLDKSSPEDDAVIPF